MGRTTTIAVRDHVDGETLNALATILTLPVRRRLQEDPEVDPDDELSLFRDWDACRGGGAGFFCQDEAERRSRRLDMRGPLDLERGPIEMEEAPEDLPGVCLRFSR